MKILYCITRSEWGGAQAHLYSLVKDQVLRGNTVWVVIGSKGELFNRLSSLRGVEVIHLPKLVRNINPVLDLRAIFSFRKIVKKFNPNIIHLHSSKAGAVGRIAAIGLPPKIIFTAHGWSFTDGVSSTKKLVYTLVEKILGNLTDVIFCVSRYDYDLAIKHRIANNKKIMVIYNGSPDPFRGRKLTDDNGSGSSNNPLRLVMVARFDAQKNQRILIETFHRFPDLATKYILTFIGDGPTMQSMVKDTQELNLSDSIKFLGFKRDVGTYLNKSDAFVLTTHYEGLPISIIEALSFGLPIVATGVGGIPEMVSKDNGFLVHNDTESIHAALVDLFAALKKGPKLGNKSRTLFLEKFEIGGELNKINSQYANVIKQF